jgi:hypothetical protein
LIVRSVVRSIEKERWEAVWPDWKGQLKRKLVKQKVLEQRDLLLFPSNLKVFCCRFRSKIVLFLLSFIFFVFVYKYVVNNSLGYVVWFLLRKVTEFFKGFFSYRNHKLKAENTNWTSQHLSQPESLLVEKERK